MLGRVSTNQLRGGPSASGALSHAYIQHPPLRCDVPETRGLHYDDGNKFLIAPTSDQVLYWKIDPSIQPGPPNSDSISEGPVISIRYSLDHKVIGIQRSNHEVEFKNRETGETFSRRCRQDSEKILGFFWTDSPTCDVILIKTSGIDLLLYEPELNTLRLVEAKKFNVSWYVYTHESRMVLLASGMQCSNFTGYQFSSGGIVRLPKFDMTMTKSEVNSKPVLAADDVHIVTVYGRIYCLQLDSVRMALNFYRFYRDAVVQQGALPIYSSRVAVSAVDNIIMVHQVDAKVVILYDVFLDSLTPISAPLPLQLKGVSNNSRQASQLLDHLSTAFGGTLYGESWTFLVPNLIYDADNGLLWRLCLDLEAIAASSSDAPSVLEFLQRRRSDANMIKSLCLAIVRAIILERRPIVTISKAIDVLLVSYAHLMRTGTVLLRGHLRPSEQNQHSGEQQIDGSNVLSEVPPTGTGINHGTSVSQASAGRRVGNERIQSNSGLEHELVDPSAESNMDGVMLHSSSDSDDNSKPSVVVGVNMETSSQGTSGVHTSDANYERSSQVGGQDSRPLASSSQQLGSQSVSVAVSPEDMFHSVFAVVEDEMTGDPAYLVSIILEFLRSASKERLRVPSILYVMLIALLARSNRYSEIALFVSNKILEPSKDVAMQLIEAGRQNFLTRKLGMDMLREMALHHEYITVLLQDGYYVEALRYARKYKVNAVQPALFLETVAAKENPHELAAVLRFFSDFKPSFKTTIDYSRYHRLLTDMNHPVPAPLELS